MLIIPAIDIKDGHCVRLRQGVMTDDTIYSSDPLAMATRWVEAGARRQRHQMPAMNCGELVSMPEGELAQEDPQRGGRIHLAEHPGCAAGAQHVDIIDALRAARHARDD